MIGDKKTLNSKSVISPDLLSKYLRHARTLTPTLTPESNKIIVAAYVDIRKQSGASNVNKGVGPRQVDAMRRLTIARAKLRLASKTNTQDAEIAVNLLRYSLSQLDIITEDVELAIKEEEISCTINNDEQLISFIEKSDNGKGVDTQKIINESNPKLDAVSRLTKLSENGSVFETKPDRWKVLK